MWKWALSAVLILCGGYVAYDYYKGGFHTMPELPEGAFYLSYKNGLRAIVVGVPDLRPERKYLGMSFDTAPWYADAWSFCTAPTPDEEAQSRNLGPGSRLEAVCRIKADDTEVLRGAIYSVPDL